MSMAAQAEDLDRQTAGDGVTASVARIEAQLQANKLAFEQNQDNVLRLVALMGRENQELLDGTSAIYNILEDFGEEKQSLESGMVAVFNILDDFSSENVWLQQSQTAMLNLLDDLDEERGKAAMSAAAMARAEAAEKHALEIKQANEALAEANRELEGFSYSVSHDLRTPLRAIDGFSRILLDDYREKLDDEGQRLLQIVRASTVKMARLIDDILAFSRAGRTEMILAPVDMAALVRGILADPLATAMAGHKLSLQIRPLPPARGDRAMLERVWTNLLDNAIKFATVKPDARIEVGAMAGDGETVYYVRDNGIGFDMQYAGTLFGVFQRLHGSEIPGTGIGLAIIKRLITRQGGRVWAESKVHEGATFYFALPRLERADA